MNEEEKDIQAVEEQDVQPAEEQQAPSYRDQLKGIYAEENPDADYEDDESIYRQAYENHKANSERNKQRDEAEKKIVDMFNMDGRSAEFFESWRDGGDPVVMLVKTYGDKFKEALDDPEKADELADANKKFLDEVAKDDAFKKECEENQKESFATLDAWQQETGKTDEEVDAVMGKLVQIAGDFIKGKITRETIEFAEKAAGYDNAVSEAKAEGEVRGRNANIEAKLKKENAGDGVLKYTGGSEAPSEEKPDDGFLRGRGRSIWDQGAKEVRRKH